LLKDFKGDSVAMTNCQYSIAAIGLMFNIISMIYAFDCLNPRLKLKGGISPIYFGSIANSFSNSKDYLEHYEANFSTDEQIVKQLAGQVYVNSCIAYKKFKLVAYSLRFLSISLAIWIVLLFTKI